MLCGTAAMREHGETWTSRHLIMTPEMIRQLPVTRALVIRAINELKMTTWLMQNVAESEQIAEEFRTRLASLHDDDAPRGWQPF